MTSTTVPATAPETMTYEEYLAWLEPEVHAEWVAGRVELMSPVSDEHDAICGAATWLLRTWVGAHRLGRVLQAPFQMKTGPELPGRSPDLFFVATEHLDRLREHHLEGPADLVVEVVSPESHARDRGEKYLEYEAGGVREYWLLDPQRRRAEFYQLADDGCFQPVLPSADGSYRSRVVDGLWLRVAWLWSQPDVLGVLREWGLGA